MSKKNIKYFVLVTLFFLAAAFGFYTYPISSATSGGAEEQVTTAMPHTPKGQELEPPQPVTLITKQ